MDYLSIEEVVALHVKTMTANGQSADVLSMAKLEAAVHRPQSGAFGEEAFPTFSLKAAALLHGLISAHAFLDGNKRIGLVATMAFLQLNGFTQFPAEEELYVLTMAIAAGELRDLEPIAQQLRALFGLPD